MSGFYKNKKIALEWTMISSDTFSTEKRIIIKKMDLRISTSASPPLVG